MSKYIRYFLFLALITLVVSCKKKTPENIGLPILPGGDVLNAQFSDTATLITHTVRDDSLYTTAVAPLLLGYSNDPVFGITTSSFFTQIAIPSGKSNPSFGTNPVLDSVVLSLIYSSGRKYGPLSAEKFKVYEVTDQMSTSVKYYSNTSLVYGTEIGSAYLLPKVELKDSVTLANHVTLPAHLRITLDKNFFKDFIDTSSNVPYNSNLSFQSFFKGIYVTTASGTPVGSGAILYIDAINKNSGVTLFYHNSTDTTSYYFGITSSGCARFSHFEHNYTSATEITSQLNSAATIQKDKVFIQPMAGLRTKVTMPYIKDYFKNGKISINKAELIIPVDPSSLLGADTVYTPHPRLVATIADSILGPVILPDYFEGGTYFGGEYDAVNKVYKFNIARYIQQVLTGKKVNEGLYLIPNGRPTTANRVQLLGGSKALPTHMSLQITYTRLE
jgi:hypothetical protein